jgi:hypothetical protein
MIGFHIKFKNSKKFKNLENNQPLVSKFQEFNQFISFYSFFNLVTTLKIKLCPWKEISNSASTQGLGSWKLKVECKKSWPKLNELIKAYHKHNEEGKLLKDEHIIVKLQKPCWIFWKTSSIVNQIHLESDIKKGMNSLPMKWFISRNHRYNLIMQNVLKLCFEVDPMLR